jgi:hypothetical protein
MSNEKPGVKVERVRKKTKCPITREEFEELAKPITITIDGKEIQGQVKVFKSGGFGFFANEKINMKIGEHVIKFQCNCNVSAVGSKPEPK